VKKKGDGKSHKAVTWKSTGKKKAGGLGAKKKQAMKEKSSKVPHQEKERKSYYTQSRHLFLLTNGKKGPEGITSRGESSKRVTKQGNWEKT